MSNNGQKREGVYVYNMAAGAPRTPAPKTAVPKGWGGISSLVRSKTHREREKVGDGGEAAAEAPRRSERRSVSGAERNVGAAVALLQVKVVASDMPAFMQVHAFRCARTAYDALEKFSSKYMAYNIKKVFISSSFFLRKKKKIVFAFYHFICLIFPFKIKIVGDYNILINWIN